MKCRLKFWTLLLNVINYVIHRSFFFFFFNKTTLKMSIITFFFVIFRIVFQYFHEFWSISILSIFCVKIFIDILCQNIKFSSKCLLIFYDILGYICKIGLLIDILAQIDIFILGSNLPTHAQPKVRIDVDKV